MAVIFFELRCALSNIIVCFNSLAYSVRMDYRHKRLNSDSFQMEPPLPYVADISRPCRRMELVVLGG